MTLRAPHPDDWRPNPGPQTDFLTRVCREALYGGAAGGGKSVALVVDAIRGVGRGYGTGYQAILFRRTYAELERGLMSLAWELYPRLGGRYNDQKKCWRFPGGEKVFFGHLEHEQDALLYQGHEYQYVGFDELTHFSEQQYLYLVGSRLRSSTGVRARARATTNPGGPGHAWVFGRWAPWLDPSCEDRAEPGEELWFLPPRKEGERERVVPRGTPGALDRTFVPARLEDNPPLAGDGRYEAGLATLDPVTRAQLRNGDWLIRKGQQVFSGVYHYERVPEPFRVGIGYDAAYTAKTTSDWSTIVALAESGGRYYVLDVRRKQCELPEFARTMNEVAATFPTASWLSYGTAQEAAIASMLRPYVSFLPVLETTNLGKLVRAQPVAAAWNDESRRVMVPRSAPWASDLVKEMTAFTGVEGVDAHDDQVDALAAAYDVLERGRNPGRARFVPGGFGQPTTNPFAPKSGFRWV